MGLYRVGHDLSSDHTRTRLTRSYCFLLLGLLKVLASVLALGWQVLAPLSLILLTLGLKLCLSPLSYSCLFFVIQLQTRKAAHSATKTDGPSCPQPLSDRPCGAGYLMGSEVQGGRW